MPAKTRSTSKTGIAYSVLMPRLARAQAGLPTSELSEYKGTVPSNVKRLEAVKRHGSPLGVHAAIVGAGKSLCHCDLDSGKAERVRVGKLGELDKVTCQFCNVRLVATGHKTVDAPGVNAYAADYGTRASAPVEVEDAPAVDTEAI